MPAEGRRGKSNRQAPRAKQSRADAEALGRALKRERSERRRTASALQSSADQLAAAGEVLRVISTSPGDAQPVFDAIVRSAARLCGATDALILRVERETIRPVAHFGPVPSVTAPGRLVTPDTPTGRAVLQRRVIHIHDILDDFARGDYPEARYLQQGTGMRTLLLVPLLREDAVAGVIVIRRTEVHPFTEQQIELVKTFADQAVIAIENVRLFNELQTSNRELTETVERETATADILRVISSSATDVQPVFRTILANTNRLCEAQFSIVWLWDQDALVVAAHHNVSPAFAELLQVARVRPDVSKSPVAWTVRERGVIHVADVLSDPRFAPEDVPAHRLNEARSILSVPMLRDGSLVGVINTWRTEPRPFTDKQITLLQTFADQAVIAIENARLLGELKQRTQDLTRSVDQLTALGDVGRAISSTLDLETVLDTVVTRSTELAGVDAGVIYEYDEPREVFEPRATHQLDDRVVRALVETPIRKGEGATGRLAELREPIQLEDITHGAFPSRARDAFIHAGYRSLLAVPLIHDERLIGGLTVIRRIPGAFPSDTIALLRTFATQSSLAIQNARLFREIEAKSAELEAASRHKSEFLANMSHELRTPLNAVIGFSEVLLERMFGEVNDKQEEYLRDILESSRHLLSLINDILDLSKIEAGRMELELTDLHLPTAIENALILVRERASRRGVALGHRIGSRLGQIRADERKIKQVLLNLLSNALKFTPDGGRVDVRAELRDDGVEVAVTDTGIGIAPEDHAAVFEEFRQVGGAEKKSEGTGLGLALCRKFVELHGGRISVTSALGKGSTFTVTLPRDNPRSTPRP